MNQAYLHCQNLVQAHDKDRFLATLFAPATSRRHLFALYAFSSEISNVRERISQPLAGEIRLQWWRDAFESRTDGSGHPVFAALNETLNQFSLPRAPFLALIEARVTDLYDDPFPTTNDWEGYCGETCSSLFRLASLIVAHGRDPGGTESCGHAGLAYALTGMLRASRRWAAQGRSPWPADLMTRHNLNREQTLSIDSIAPLLEEVADKARHHLKLALDTLPDMEMEARSALLPLALARTSLAKVRPWDDRPGLPRKVFTLWRLSRRL